MTILDTIVASRDETVGNGHWPGRRLPSASFPPSTPSPSMRFPHLLRLTVIVVSLAWSFTSCMAVDSPPQPSPLSPIEARMRVGENIELQMKVRVAKDRLERRAEIYLDSELDFLSEKNFAVVITEKGARSLRARGIRETAEHFQCKRIHVKGLVKVIDGVPRIEVDDADQIKLLKKPSVDAAD